MKNTVSPIDILFNIKVREKKKKPVMLKTDIDDSGNFQTSANTDKNQSDAQESAITSQKRCSGSLQLKATQRGMTVEAGNMKRVCLSPQKSIYNQSIHKLEKHKSVSCFTLRSHISKNRPQREQHCNGEI